MEFRHLTVLGLLCQLSLIGGDASQSLEDQWQSLFPEASVPKPLRDLLQPYGKTQLPIKVEEEKQYWTVFFEHDLHPQKIMKLGLPKQVDRTNQPFGTRTWLSEQEGGRRTNQPFGVRTWLSEQEGTNQPFGTRIWRSEQEGGKKTNQPFGTRIWRSEQEEFCGNTAAIGEEKYCASSLESMVDYATSKLGKNIKVISSSFAQNHDEYVVEEVNKIGDKAVMCHRLNSEDVVFYCHQVNATRIYMVPMEASDGTKAKAVTVCHHDTRGMNSEMLQEILKVKPGTVPICHFVGNKAIAWVPNDVVTSEPNHPCRE